MRSDITMTADAQCDFTSERTSGWRGRAAQIGALLAVLAGLTSAGLAGAPTASASAYGCTPYDDFRYEGISPANWCGGPNGSGRTIDSVTATFASSFAGVGYLCDTSMRVVVFDDQGSAVWSGITGITYGCGQAGGAFSMPMGVTLGTDGHVETTLLSYGATLATLSHTIHG